MSGVPQTVIGPTAAARAVATVRWISRACRAAAPSGPSTGSSRVFTSPASGAFAKIAIVTGSSLTGRIAVLARKRRGLGAQEIGEPQPAHQKDRSRDAMLLPAPAGCNDALRQTNRPSAPFQQP